MHDISAGLGARNHRGDTNAGRIVRVYLEKNKRTKKMCKVTQEKKLETKRLRELASGGTLGEVQRPTSALQPA